MKTLTSFRLTQMAKQNLKYLSKKHKLSESDIIEAMGNFFVDTPSIEFDFNVYMTSYKIKKSKAFKNFSEEYEKADAQQQKIMLQTFLENQSNFID